MFSFTALSGKECIKSTTYWSYAFKVDFLEQLTYDVICEFSTEWYETNT